MIIFQNKGEIECTAFTYFGVNAKVKDGAIGYFGTGLKYALAVLLRHDCSITIWSGLTKIEIFSKPMEFRGKHFNAICARTDGVESELGFTDEVGKNWDLWMAYRELYSNCKDEEGQVIETRSHLLAEPEEGSTKIVVVGDEFAEIHSSRHETFIEKPFDVLELDGVEVHSGSAEWVFVKGIRCAELSRPAMYTYNFKKNIVLTEDRTVRDMYSLRADLAKSIMKSRDVKFLRSVLVAKSETFEAGLDYHGWHVEPSIEFLGIVGAFVSDRVTDLNGSALKLWQQSTRKSIAPKEFQLSKIQKEQFDSAVAFCKFLKFNVSEYPTKFVETLGGSTIGMAHDDTIYISQRVFDIGGAKQLASTLIEEFIHLKHGYEDASLQMQTFLFERMTTIGEELYGRSV